MKERTNERTRISHLAEATLARVLVPPNKRTSVIPPVRGVTVDCLER